MVVCGRINFGKSRDIGRWGYVNCGRRDHFDADRHDAFADHVDVARCALREVDDSSFDEGSAIGDAHVDLFSVGEVGDFKPGVEGKSAMRRGEAPHVVDLAGGGVSSVVRNAVPACDSRFGLPDVSRARRGRDVRARVSSAA